MTINIITTQVDRKKITGPKKVLLNTCKGFDALNITYVFNAPMEQYDYIWIQDKQMSIIEAGFLQKPILVGPNTTVLPKDLPILRKKLHKDSVYLTPSDWTKKMWVNSGFNECKIISWPVGIDLETISHRKREKSEPNRILIYFKQRDPQLLEDVKKIILDEGMHYEVIHYGYYDQNDYMKSLNGAKLCIWIGCSESQGIALQEALASGLPIVVLDAKSLFDVEVENKKGYFDYHVPRELEKLEVTSAPYFDERCGVKITSLSQMKEAIHMALESIEAFRPREFIEENLSLKQSSLVLVEEFLNFKQKGTQKYISYQTFSKYLFYFDLFLHGWFYRWLKYKFLNTLKKG